MTWGFVASAAVSVIGGAISANGASKAADAQTAAADRAAALQDKQYQQSRQDMLPFLQGGYAGENKLLTLLGLKGGDATDPTYGSMGKSFGASDFQADPGYQFRLDQGMKALDRTAAARGGLISGQALKAASGFSGQQASDEYQSAYNRYNANRAAILNPLQSLTGMGQSQSNALSNQSQAYANANSDLYTQKGNAQASGYIGDAQAWNTALSGVYNSAVNNGLLKGKA